MAAIYKAVLTWTGGGQLFANVLHLNIGDVGAHRPDQYNDKIIDSFSTNYLPPWLDCVSETVEVSSLMVQKITGAGGFATTKTFASEEAQGTRVGSIGQTSENVCLEFPVHLNDKNVNGKVFVSGILDSDIVDNEIVDTAKTRVLALGTTLLGTYNLDDDYGTMQYVIYNRATGFFATPTFRRLSPFVGSQRRRLRP